ncbi:heavy-metal-associated domain-containing protein [Mycobacterium shigaense]|uniref:Putative heavy metal transport/detoxification protein n=1 Tax=Mycobacterium shigaense TaxID=722731 RepID=A0A1Z4EJX5_9MYCO|nr:heavy metal-associated domain-containing protein [Mycobacterium shigaense]MEA1123104.1 heavy metal-associated domain-containing protein [Mycobacterium shigaense]PRI15610.1 heavy metal transporter [Mycobacterium shigaense]BAX93285.1 putative heavy metal transport/detoxification protein [Mycobacterium shigaense]
MTQQTFAVTGLRCGGCVDTVKQVLLKLDGVKDVDVTLQTAAASSVRIETDRLLEQQRVQEALATKGDFQIQP